MSELSILERLIEENPNIFNTSYNNWTHLSLNLSISLKYIYEHPIDLINNKYLWKYEQVLKRNDLILEFLENFIIQYGITNINNLNITDLDNYSNNRIDKCVNVYKQYHKKYPDTLFIKGSNTHYLLFKYIFTEEEIEEYIKKYGINDQDISWLDITMNQNITWTFYSKYLKYIKVNRLGIFKYQEHLWYNLASHKNTTLEFINSTRKDKNYKWSINDAYYNPNLTLDFYKSVSGNREYKFNSQFYKFFLNFSKDITIHTLKYIPKDKWHWISLFINDVFVKSITKEFIQQHATKLTKGDWNYFFEYVPIAEKFINMPQLLKKQLPKFLEKSSIIWCLAQNKYLTTSFLYNFLVNKNIFHQKYNHIFTSRHFQYFIMTNNLKLNIINKLILENAQNNDFWMMVGYNPNLTYKFINEHKQKINFEILSYNSFDKDEYLIEANEREKVIKCTIFVILRRVAIQDALVAYEEARKHDEPSVRRSKRLRAQI